MLEKDLEIKDTDKQWRKFVDLFNEWWEEEFEEKGHFTYTMRFDHAHIINKKFGFIQRLVKNNKIDIERLHKIVDYRLEIKENYVNAHDYNSNCLLMLLAISNTPIEDLITYLK